MEVKVQPRIGIPRQFPQSGQLLQAKQGGMAVVGARLGASLLEGHKIRLHGEAIRESAALGLQARRIRVGLGLDPLRLGLRLSFDPLHFGPGPRVDPLGFARPVEMEDRRRQIWQV
jgi:hypothetical protein